jgi:hypothetical protein
VDEPFGVVAAQTCEILSHFFHGLWQMTASKVGALS